jgi:hypothetical protein
MNYLEEIKKHRRLLINCKNIIKTRTCRNNSNVVGCEGECPGWSRKEIKWDCNLPYESAIHFLKNNSMAYFCYKLSDKMIPKHIQLKADWDEYLEEQKKSGLKVGDTVRVIRVAGTREAGWCNSWVPVIMGDMVGKMGKITSIDGVCGIGLSHEYDYPYFVLEKVNG